MKYIGHWWGIVLVGETPVERNILRDLKEAIDLASLHAGYDGGDVTLHGNIKLEEVSHMNHGGSATPPRFDVEEGDFALELGR